MTALPGLPGGGHFTERPSAPVKQTTYVGVQISVQGGADGSRALIVNAPGETLVFPMDSNAARTIGGALIAPGVELPGRPA